jgi:hypothetical protein
MAYLEPAPNYSVMLKDGEHWIVEAEWPDGTIEQVATFKSYFDARDWLSARSKSCAPRPRR